MTNQETGNGRKRSNAGLIVLLALVVVGGAFLAFAWNSGRESAMQDEEFQAACGLAAETSDELSACLAGMKATYTGPIDNYDQLANAAAQHVADARSRR